MLVIDCLRQAVDNTIAIPTFHRGHLGLMPDTPVSIALMTEPAAKKEGCEILITPFNCDTSNFFKLTCILTDQPGAVDRIVAAVSLLKINIVLQESAPINHLRQHITNMTLDWTPSDLPEELPIPQEYQRCYSALSQAIPPDDLRYYKLYEQLVKHCGDILKWKPSLNPSRDLPQITMTSFEHRHLFVADYSKVHASEESGKSKRGRKCTIEIPEKILARVREVTGHEPKDPIPYVLASDTATRTLRVSFFRKDREDRIIHVAFSHHNQTGALATITKLLAKANFNIVTSLLRFEGPATNVWEVLLEDKREGDFPKIAESKDAARWVKERLSQYLDIDDRGALRRFNVIIKTPRYPRSKYDDDFHESVVPEGDGFDPAEPNKSITSGAGVGQRSQQYDQARIDSIIGTGQKKKRRDWALPFFNSTRLKTTIFFSYPATACLHVALIKKALGDGFLYDEYQEPNAADITRSVIEKIERSDYFLAVWHPEPGKPTEISPWMPFEFGIASVLGKKSIIVIADTIDERNWRRISPNISRHRYSDARFSVFTVPEIKKFVEENWSADPPDSD